MKLEKQDQFHLCLSDFPVSREIGRIIFFSILTNLKKEKFQLYFFLLFLLPNYFRLGQPILMIISIWKLVLPCGPFFIQFLKSVI